MIIKHISSSDEDTAVHQLPESDMVVDPRSLFYDRSLKFEVTVNGTTLTITRIGRKQDQCPGWDCYVRFRVYSRNEFHYPFDSTKYLYHGIDYEYAPQDVTEVIVKNGVTTINFFAFMGCYSLSKITIPNSVTRIEKKALHDCKSLKCIQLPPSLQYIGREAFANCSLLENIYIPPTVTDIQNRAFACCASLRIINIPDSIQLIHYQVIYGCHALLTDDSTDFNNSQQFDQWVKNRYNPLHNLCWDPSVTVSSIQQYIQQHHDNEERATTTDRPQFTPLHLLAANPSVTGEMIQAYLQLTPDVAIMQDDKGKTPLHILCSLPSVFEGTGGAIKAYMEECVEGKKAAFIRDGEGRTPFYCLCEKHFDELVFLENKTLGGLMTWWYVHCLDINLFAENIDVRRNRKRKVSVLDDSEKDVDVNKNRKREDMAWRGMIVLGICLSWLYQRHKRSGI